MVPLPDAQVTVRAPAKVNLLLEVGPRRDDGFHDLVTVFQALSLYEEVTAAPAEEFSVTVEGVDGTDVADVPLDGANLALRAARLLAERGGVDEAVALHVRKGVPVAGGMAGGSADAAAALVACDALWGLHAGLDALAELGAELGSDVPFGLHGRTAVGTGRGTELAPVLTEAAFSWVLVPGVRGLPTPAVYAECDRLRAAGLAPAPTAQAGDEGRLRAVEAALRSGDPAQLGAALSNDLQAAACSLAPELTGTLAAGAAAGALAGIVSGSGPTVALLAASAAEADRIAGELAGQLAGQLAGGARVRTATGPVPGARVLEAVAVPVRHRDGGVR
ncbi:4-(cytidine 5'-diphospho)-2-C-methyl-D-erythritol kinase [Kineococcus sp. SYSU DK006]|uniref:4-(cytidine 5'-diphospho)-2-C-methyl-D-erythritol kinase n=1 Tax=Kineococcus sp. SYSU DK006 TaxID=3383127 RepID=UPI003D7DEB38